MNNNNNSEDEIEKNVSKSEVEKYIERLPQDKQTQFYKLVANAGLREDDELWSRLLVNMSVKDMFEDIPGCMNDLIDTLQNQSTNTAEELGAVLEEKMGDFRKEIDMKINELDDMQNSVVKEFKDAADTYLQIISKANKNVSAVVEGQQALARKLVVESLKTDFPDIANKHLGQLVNVVKEKGWKKFFSDTAYFIFIGTSCVLMSETVRNLFPNLFR